MLQILYHCFFFLTSSFLAEIFAPILTPAFFNVVLLCPLFPFQTGLFPFLLNDLHRIIPYLCWLITLLSDLRQCTVSHSALRVVDSALFKPQKQRFTLQCSYRCNNTRQYICYGCFQASYTFSSPFPWLLTCFSINRIDFSIRVLSGDGKMLFYVLSALEVICLLAVSTPSLSFAGIPCTVLDGVQLNISFIMSYYATKIPINSQACSRSTRVDKSTTKRSFSKGEV